MKVCGFPDARNINKVNLGCTQQDRGRWRAVLDSPRGDSVRSARNFGELPLEIPRDRQGMFEPQLVSKHQTHWTGFDDKVSSLYARGMTLREIQGHPEEMYGTEVSPQPHLSDYRVK
ncbi:transposase-like protein [Pseudomonas sp. 3296]|nr:transposase-like protein [Pseudomonas sp. 3296]